MTLRYAYNTNGTASHRLDDALELMKEAGYDGVALTLDYNHFDPFASDWRSAAGKLRKRLDAIGFGCVIETGARYLLDPRQKHEPTFVSVAAEGRARRIAFLHRAIDIGAILGAEAVSFWGGVPKPGIARADAKTWLSEGVAAVTAYAKRQGVVPALEPEPGMIIETVDDFLDLASSLPDLRLALDLGHLLVTEERTPDKAIHEFAARLGTVALEDMKRRQHVHLAFGDGDMDVPAALTALHEIGFDKLVCVELSRDSHRADTMIGEARRQLAMWESELVVAA